MKLLPVLVALLIAAFATTSKAQPSLLPIGGSVLTVSGGAPDGSDLRVWTYRPDDLRPDDRIVIVMHGVQRNGRTYRDSWIRHAREQRVLVLVPEMSKKQFPGSAGYNLGNMVDRSGKSLPREQWAWGVIEKVFDAAKAATGSKRDTYVLYGHSAGAQFVHRMVMFADRPRFEIAIAANAGWYTVPTAEVPFPYGFGGAVAPVSLQQAFERKLVVLLGSADDDPEDKVLRRSGPAMKQGATRIERGNHFLELASSEAKRHGAAYAWQLEIIPGVKHSNRGMSAAAMPWITGAKR